MRAAGLPLTVNAVVHRQNLEHARGDDRRWRWRSGAGRLEVAHVQYYGWALQEPRGADADARAARRARPSVVDRGARAAERRAGDRLRRARLLRASGPRPAWAAGGGSSSTSRPPARCCHATPRRRIPGLAFDRRCATRPLADDLARIATPSTRFRGTDWMPEPCRCCERREIDWGGCRCQAFALTGQVDAVDPACGFSPDHAALVAVAGHESAAAAPSFVYRRIGAATRQPATADEI